MKKDGAYWSRVNRELVNANTRKWYKEHIEELTAKRNTPEAKERKRIYDKAYRKLRSTVLRGREHSRKYSAKPEVKEYRKAWRVQRIGAATDSNLRRLYGISLKTRNDMLERQLNRCAICRVVLKTPHTDHFVLEGKKIVRGLLCSNCNTGIGLLGENPEVMRSAIEYLENAYLLAIGVAPHSATQPQNGTSLGRTISPVTVAQSVACKSLPT